MERLLVLRLAAQGVAAAALLNGVPIARVGGACKVVVLPVHEYALAGANQIELVVEPGPAAGAAAPAARLGDGRSAAVLQLLLPRNGQPAHPSSARTLAQLEWTAPADEVIELPLSLRQGVELPIPFTRWRWVDAPAVADASVLRPAAAAFLQGLAVALARGNLEPFVVAARLRFEELAAAYQRNLSDEVGRWRVHLQALHAALPLAPALPTAATLVLRPIAGGRLLECLRPDGEPVLQCPVAGGATAAWPVRLGWIEERFYVLR